MHQQKLIVNNRNYQPFVKLNRENWIPVKCGILAWRAEQDRIPMKDALTKRGMAFSDDSCLFCESNKKSSSHIFTGCIFATEVWSRISAWCRLNPIFAFDVRDLLMLVKGFKMGKYEKRAMHGIILTTLWCIWIARNERIFQRKTIKAIEVVTKIKSTSYFWITNRSRHKHLDWNDWCTCPIGLM
ncbi:uncharacterized protein LOC143609734 [Bidens hawaiensis]|uniref:uncharacterized protein LOC143609734 n=1 Tax=Bidens hawaiensis TaxID=980011 RepID=UPI00404AAA38